MLDRNFRSHALYRILNRVPASIGCGDCARCLSGKVYLCESHPSGRAYGHGDPTIPGCQAVAIPVTMAENNLFHLPVDFSDELGLMLTDNIATAWYCARRGRVGPGDTVAVIELGSVGLQIVMAAFATGAEKVFGLDLLEDRRQAAEEIGATNAGGENVVAKVVDATMNNQREVSQFFERRPDVLENCKIARSPRFHDNARNYKWRTSGDGRTIAQ